MPEPPVESTIEPIENILLKIVLAFRILGWVWLFLLVVASLLTDSATNRLILISMAAGSLVWTAFTVWMARDQARFKSAAFVLADGAVVLLIANASYYAGSASLLHGGFPISWIAVVAYATDVRWALGAGVVLFINQWLGMEVEGSYAVPDQVGAVVSLVYAAIVGYGFDLIRSRDDLRMAATEKLAVVRRRQIRHTEQLALADQLHDSVLQSLHAIRVSPDDAEQVTFIARKQERELRVQRLTPREREVVHLIARGYTYRESASKLGMRVKTLESHMAHIFEKLGVATRSELSFLAYETGMVDPSHGRDVESR